MQHPKKFNWIGKQINCPDKDFTNKNYNFYSACTIERTRYEIGDAVTLLINDKTHIACIHYFFGNPDSLTYSDKFNLAAEIFHKADDLKGKIENPVEFHDDFEVIKQDKISLTSASLEAIKAHCLLVYGLEDEDPQDLYEEFRNTTRDVIYVCRFIAKETKGTYRLRGAVVNEVEISDDELSKSFGQDSTLDKSSDNNTSDFLNEFTVTNIQHEQNRVRIILKKQDSALPVSSSASEVETESKTDSKNCAKANSCENTSEKSISCHQISPSVLLRRLRLSDVNSPKPDLINNINFNFKQLIISGISLEKSSVFTPEPLDSSATIKSSSSKLILHVIPKDVPKITRSQEQTKLVDSKPVLSTNQKQVENQIEAADSVPVLRTITEGSEDQTRASDLKPVLCTPKSELCETSKMAHRKSNRISATKSILLQSADTPIPVKRRSVRKSYAEFYTSPEFSPVRQSARIRSRKGFDSGTETPKKIRHESDVEFVGADFISNSTPKKKLQATKTKISMVETLKKVKFITKDPESESETETPRKQSRMTRTPKATVETPKKVKFLTDEEEETETPKARAVRTPKNYSLKKIIADDVENVEVDDFRNGTPKKQSRIMKTPTSCRVVLRNLTPNVVEREEAIIDCSTLMQKARIGLSANSMPKKMPCRENEYANIYDFVSRRVIDQSSGCMYISGVPGTGKTMTVRKVMSDLSDHKGSDHMPDFSFLQLNALALTEPRQIYVEIIKNLLNKTLYWEEALKEVNRFFTAKKKKKAHVILIDELDKLCNKKQDVIYNLLDLPFNTVTPLILISIANTMDLPERVFTSKITSRLGLVRLTFRPYQHKDLIKIITERLSSDAVFKSEALELVARKVAAVSGDARRALAMCCRATEIAELDGKNLVNMEIVDQVVKEMISSAKVQAIKSCSKLERFILSAVSNEVTRTGNEEVPFLNMLYNLEKLSCLESFKLPSINVCLRQCQRLGSFRLLITQHGRTDVNMTLLLNISPDDIHFALQ